MALPYWWPGPRPLSKKDAEEAELGAATAQAFSNMVATVDENFLSFFTVTVDRDRMREIAYREFNMAQHRIDDIILPVLEELLMSRIVGRKLVVKEEDADRQVPEGA